MIKIEHLKKKYPNVTPLKDVCAEIHDGDVISVIGSSGTGKSTFLRCINQLEQPSDGHIWLNDLEITDKKCDINKVRQRMGMVFQSFNLFPHLTVIENIMLSPMDLLGKDKQEAYDEGMQLLRTVGLAEKALNYENIVTQMQTACGNELFYHTFMNRSSRHNYEVDFLITRKICQKPSCIV